MILRLIFFGYVTTVFSSALASVKPVDLNNYITNSDEESDAFLNSFELLTKYGYSPQKHTVITEDGYILTLFRIPNNGPPVILVHGITDSSDEWLVLGPQQSLAYQLSDAGFDVWLYNCRGNKYSKEHRRNIPKKEYWDFSFEEMGTQDLPASIDYILNVTKREKLYYVGFSQGTTIFFVLCSMIPEYNSKVEQAILLAPVAWINNIKYPLIHLVSLNMDLFSLLTTGIGLYDLIPFNSEKPFRTLDCNRKYSKEICSLEYFVSFGLKKSSRLSRFIVVDSHVPAGVSVKTFLHYTQCFRSKRFQRYDYGLDKNLEIYFSKHPTSYNVSQITVPINMIVSETDWFSQVDDVQILRQKLPNIKKYVTIKRGAEFSHLEFVYGSRVNKLVNEPVLNILRSNLDSTTS